MKTAIKDTSGSKTFRSRFFMLFLSTLACLSIFYCQDIPSIIKGDFIELFDKKYPGDAEYYFDLMYSTYSLPNIFLPILSGMLIDKIGYGLPLILFSSCILLGNAIIYAGVRLPNVIVILAGRFIFGLGGESLTITQGALLIYWFKGKELGFSQALGLSIGRLASVINCYVSPKAAENGIGSSYAVALGVCTASFLGALFAGIADTSAKNRSAELDASQDAARLTSTEKPSRSLIDQLYRCKPIVWFHIAAIVMFYLSYLPFSMVASTYFEERWFQGANMTQIEKTKQIGTLLSIPLMISAVLFPVFGYAVDKIGRRLEFLLLSSVLLITSYCLFLTTNSGLPLVILGLSYAIFGAICWSALALLVPHSIVGTILGLVTILQNFTLTIFPMFLAYLTTKNNSSLESILSLLMNSVATLVMVCFVWLFDRKNKVSLKSVDQDSIMRAVEEEYFENKTIDNSDEEEENLCLL